MTIVKLEFTPASIPYKHREVSSQVRRDGVSDIVVRAEADNGLVGWGESCSGADLESVLAALHAMKPFVLGRNPWESERIRAELWHRGIWSFRKATASFAYAGIDMALWDICGKACGQPLFNLFGGRVRETVNYFYYLAQAPRQEIAAQCRDGLSKGFHVFYLKAGIDIERELEMVGAIRETGGARIKIRLDANGAWTVNEALRNLARLDAYGIDFIEQPVMQDPPEGMREVRSRCRTAVCANEGLWTAEDAYRQMKSRTADVYCFSPYWVGSLALFQRLSFVAHCEGLQVVKHTHGEFGIAAAAAQHVLLTLPNLADGNQQTAYMMEGDVVWGRIPIAGGPDWGVPQGAGLGVEVDPEQLGCYHELYRQRGQFLPYDPVDTGREV